MYKTLQQNNKKLETIFGDNWYKIHHITITNEPYMKLHFESLGGNRFAIAHFLKENGDLVPDPYMEILYHPKYKLVEALSFRDKYDYIAAYPVPGHRLHVDKEAQISLNNFLSQWLSNLITQVYCNQTELPLGCF